METVNKRTYGSGADAISSRQFHPVFDSDAIWQSTSYTEVLPRRAPHTRFANGRMKTGEHQSSGMSWQHCHFQLRALELVACAVFLFPVLSSLKPPCESKYTKCPKGSYIPTIRKLPIDWLL